MKFLIVIPVWSYRGGERIFISLGEGLAANGHDVTVIAGRKESFALTISSKIKKATYPKKYSRLLQNDMFFYLFGSLFIAAEIHKNIKNADWIITESNQCHIASVLMGKLYRVPVAWYVMAYEQVHFANKFVNIIWEYSFGVLEKLAVYGTARFFFLADRVKDTIYDKFGKSGIILNPMITLAKGYKLSKVKASIRKIFTTEEVLFVPGALHWKKNQKIAIETLAQLADKYPRLSLVFAGEGKEKENLAKQAQEMRVERRVHFVGVIKADTLVYAYKHAKATLVCSINDNEGLSLTSLESLYLGTPAIVSTEAGVSRLLNREKLGTVRKPNPKDFSMAVESILSGKKSVIKREKEYIEKHFGQKHVVETLLRGLTKEAYYKER